MWHAKQDDVSPKNDFHLTGQFIAILHKQDITCERIMTSDYEEGFYYSLSLVMDPFRDAYCNKTRITSMPIVGFREQPVLRTRSEPAQRIRKAQDIPEVDQRTSTPAIPNNV